MDKKRRFRSLGLAFLALPLMAGCSHSVFQADAVDLLVDGNGYMVDTSTLKLTGNTSFSFRTGDWTFTNLMTGFEFVNVLQWQVGGVWKDCSLVSFYPVGDEYNEEYSGYYRLKVMGDGFSYDDVLRSGNMVWPTYSGREFSINTRLYQPDVSRPLEFRIPLTVSINFSEEAFNTLLSVSNFTRSVPPDLSTSDFVYHVYDMQLFYQYFSGDYARGNIFTSSSSINLASWSSGGCYGWLIPTAVYYTYQNDAFVPYQVDYYHLRVEFDYVNPWFDLDLPFAIWFGDIDGNALVRTVNKPLEPDIRISGMDPAPRTHDKLNPDFGYVSAERYPMDMVENYYNDFSFADQSFVTFADNYYEELIGYVQRASVKSHDNYVRGLADGKIEILNDVSTSTLSYKAGYNTGYNYGYGIGYSEGSTGRSLIFSLFGAVTSVPINVLNGLSPLAIWDTPLISIIITLLFVGLFLFLIKRFFFGGR